MNHHPLIPADVPRAAHKDFINNLSAITRGTNNLMLFAADQKIEHLNTDFYGPNIASDAADPLHLFEIAHQGDIGAFATQLGLISRYGRDYPDINYIAKLNAKTNIIPAEQEDPISTQLWSVDDVLALKKYSNINLCGIGMTIYVGSSYEGDMFAQAAQEIRYAHEHGLIAILWIYARGKYVTNSCDAAIIAGATGIGHALGADIVKVNAPHKTSSQTSAQLLKQAVMAAGNTKVICAGGPTQQPEQFLQELYSQMHIGGTQGSATGRNIFQHSREKAIAMTKAIAHIVYHNGSVQESVELL